MHSLQSEITNSQVSGVYILYKFPLEAQIARHRALKFLSVFKHIKINTSLECRKSALICV